MNALQALRALGPIDLRSVRRDSMLAWMVFLPVTSALILRWGLPPLTARVLERYQFDLAPYYPVMLGYFFVVMTPLIFAMLIGFLLLDEKDDRTLTALQVTPLSLNAYMAYRITIPVLLTLIMVAIIFPLSRLDPLPWAAILLVGIASAPIAPMFALYLAGVAENKVQGFALMKLSGSVLLLPVFAFFVEPAWQWLFGLVPTYWAMKTYWLLSAGEWPAAWLHLLGALLYPAALTWLLARRFNRAMQR